MRPLLIILFLQLLFCSAFAQTGTIRVSVYDEETGEALIGANVVLAGTTTGSVTDLDGKASIKDIEPGNYNIQISYVSYQSKTIEDVKVDAGKVSTLNVKLATESVGLQEVVVTAEAVKNSENALLTLQRKSPSVLDAISADMFSRNGDNDAAAAVKRVTGVTVEGGKYVYVRGLGDRYSKSILNGADIPGLDPNRNSVQLDLFPSNLIDNIIVYKTFSPELTGEFTGGLVNITTKDFPDRFTFQISGSASFNDQSTFNNDFLTYKGSSTDWLGFDNGFRDIPAEIKGIPENEFPSPARLGLQSPSGPITQEDIESATKSFTNREFSPNSEVASPSYNFSLSVGNQKEVFGKSLGFIAGLTYRRNFDFYSGGEVTRYSGITTGTSTLDRDVIYSASDTRSQEEINLGGLLNLSLKLNNNNKLSFNIMHNQSGNQDTRYQFGYRLDNTPDSTNLYQNRVLSWTQRGLTNYQLKGEHNLPGLDNINIDWFSSYTSSSLDQPDLRFMYNNIFLRGEDSTYSINNRNRPGRYYRNMNETNWDSRLNITIPVKVWGELEGKVKTGFAFTQKERGFREDRYEYFVNPRNYNGNIDNIFASENLGYSDSGAELTTLELFTQEDNNYDADQQIYASYLMVDAPIVEKLKLTGGVRFERTEMNLKSFGGVTGHLENNDFLPALNFTYEMAEEMNFRVAYGKTIARPTFREFAPLVTFAFYDDPTQLGNANLKRTLIDNFDLRWEMYPRSGEYLGFSAFYKHFNNPIENTLNPDAGGSVREYKYENVDAAMLVGAEVEVRKNLDFISPALEYFKLGVNFSYIYSKVSLEADELQAIKAFDPDAKDLRVMYNQSPYVVNANLIYDNPDNGLSSNLTFNVFGPRLALFQTDLPFIYEQPRPELNFSIKKDFNDRLSARIRINNILDAAFKQTIEYKGIEYVYDKYAMGRDFSIGFTYLIE